MLAGLCGRFFVFIFPLYNLQANRAYFSVQCTKDFTYSASINNKESVENLTRLAFSVPLSLFS